MGLRRTYLDRDFPAPKAELPLIVFGCAFHSNRCRACGLEGYAGETLTCRLASIWALGRGNFSRRWGGR